MIGRLIAIVCIAALGGLLVGASVSWVLTLRLRRKYAVDVSDPTRAALARLSEED